MHQAQSLRIIPTSCVPWLDANAEVRLRATILGQPDFFKNDAYSSDYRLLIMTYIEIKEKDYTGNLGKSHTTCGLLYRIDRYCFSRESYRSIFRYSYQDRYFYGA